MELEGGRGTLYTLKNVAMSGITLVKNRNENSKATKSSKSERKRVPVVLEERTHASKFPNNDVYETPNWWCNWSGVLISWLVGDGSKSQPVRSFD